MAGRFWLVVPIIVEGGSLVETAGGPALVIGYPCRVFSWENRGAGLVQPYVLLGNIHGGYGSA